MKASDLPFWYSTKPQEELSVTHGMCQGNLWCECQLLCRISLSRALFLVFFLIHYLTTPSPKPILSEDILGL